MNVLFFLPETVLNILFINCLSSEMLFSDTVHKEGHSTYPINTDRSANTC